jgi:hypothetical protein
VADNPLFITTFDERVEEVRLIISALSSHEGMYLEACTDMTLEPKVRAHYLELHTKVCHLVEKYRLSYQILTGEPHTDMQDIETEGLEG